jgi:DNA modification methylase
MTLIGRWIMIDIRHGDCIAEMQAMDDACVDAIVTDPPYELGFMGKGWDATGIANSVEMWREALRVLKPGGHMLAFSSTRTYHRMVCAIEDAGFEVRDQIFWVYGSGFPKSLDVSKAIDKAAGAEREVIGEGPFASRRPSADHSKQGLTFADDAYVRPAGHAITAPATPAAQQWAGWGTALKPAHEPICVARKPLIGTVAANVLKYGCGAINIDACRVATDGAALVRPSIARHDNDVFGKGLGAGVQVEPAGRWPANVIHDGSDEVLEAFGERKTGNIRRGIYRDTESDSVARGHFNGWDNAAHTGDTGTAARFFYSAKASKADRAGSSHPCVKPISLMKYLVKLVTPPGGTVLDPFAGSGTTLQAAMEEGFSAIGIEQDATYVTDIRNRISAAREGLGLFAVAAE